MSRKTKVFTGIFAAILVAISVVIFVCGTGHLLCIGRQGDSYDN